MVFLIFDHRHEPSLIPATKEKPFDYYLLVINISFIYLNFRIVFLLVILNWRHFFFSFFIFSVVVWISLPCPPFSKMFNDRRFSYYAYEVKVSTPKSSTSQLHFKWQEKPTNTIDTHTFTAFQKITNKNIYLFCWQESFWSASVLRSKIWILSISFCIRLSLCP